MSRDKDPPDPPPYEVGYRKPPLHSRFAKGHSGNPRGRPAQKQKSSSSRGLIDSSMREAFLQLAKREIPTNSGGALTIRDAVQKAEVSAALKGNTHAQKNFLNQYRQYEEEYIRDTLEFNDKLRNYIANYPSIIQWYLKAGKPVPDELLHPDDIVFVEGDYARFKGGDPETAAQNRRWMVLFRDALILQAEADYRLFKRTHPNESAPIFVSGFLAIFTNTCLPERLQLNELEFLTQVNKARILRKAELAKRVKEGWKKCGLTNVKGRTSPPLKPLLTQLGINVDLSP
jgi:hypothetical protein